MLKLLPVLLLASAPAVADQFYPCSAVAQAPGLPDIVVPCNESPFSSASLSISTSGQGLSVHFLNYAAGSAAGPDGYTVTAALSARVVGTYTRVITGGSGSGMLTPISSEAYYGNYFGGEFQNTFQSNFLPFPHTTYFGEPPPPIPFVFDQVFTLTIDSDIEGSTSRFGLVNWELLQQWDVIYAITDGGGKAMPAARFVEANVPESESVCLLATILLVLSGSARYRRRYCRRFHPNG